MDSLTVHMVKILEGMSLEETESLWKGFIGITRILEEHQKLVSLNWNGRFRLILALVFPSPTYMRWRYQFKSAWLLPYYFLYRWWEIFKDLLETVKSVLLTAKEDKNGRSD